MTLFAWSLSLLILNLLWLIFKRIVWSNIAINVPIRGFSIQSKFSIWFIALPAYWWGGFWEWIAMTNTTNSQIRFVYEFLQVSVARSFSHVLLHHINYFFSWTPRIFPFKCLHCFQRQGRPAYLFDCPYLNQLFTLGPFFLLRRQIYFWLNLLIYL